MSKKFDIKTFKRVRLKEGTPLEPALSKFKKKRMAEGFLLGLKQAVDFETAFVTCRREILFHIDEHIENLRALKPKTQYQKRKVLNQLEALERVRCSIRNFVNP